jgi:RND superfamily putative drug exporter
MSNGKVNAFGKLGRLITKRKWSIIAVWILLLAIILPVVVTATGVTSLTMSSSTDLNLESAKAENIITSQFQKTVSNDSLIIIISTNDASSLNTQRFIDELSDAINGSSDITGIENITSVYSILVPALNATNQGVYATFKGGNLTYNLLYSVPTIYSNVWFQAYNTTKNSQLIPGLNQTNQAVYAVLDNANMTYNLLYSVPAIYLNAWGQAYQSTGNIDQSNQAAYQQTATYLSQADPASYAQYTSQLLYAFNATWAGTFQDPATQTLTPDVRASLAANITNQQYINTALAGNASMQDFATALTQTFSLDSFLNNTPDQNNAQLRDFSIQYIANQSGSAVSFVNAAYNLGRTPATGALANLADNVIWNSRSYGMDKFIPLFNSISYNQTKTILEDIDESSYVNYTSHMLNLFNSSWAARVPLQPTSSTAWINSTASAAADVANPQFIAAYLSDGKDFATQIASTLKLQDYLNANTTDTNAKLENLTINYVSNQSGLSKDLVTAIYNMGENASLSTVQALASNIVSDPTPYNIGEEFESLLTSFVSPSKDVTLVSISFTSSDDTNLLAIRSIIAQKLAQNPADINSAQVTGNDALNYDFGQSTTKDLEIILPITIALLIIATGLFFRSVVTPIVTLGTIGIGLGVSQIFPYLVGTYINQVDYTVSTVLMTVLIGVGTDYSIFILARHREERVNSLPLFEAIKKSITWAGESIVTSGATVIISFLALAATSMVLLQTMGLVVGCGVIVTLLASLTFAPAIAVVLGDRIFWPNSGERFQRYAQGIVEKNRRRGGYFAKSGGFSVKHGKTIILIAVLVTLPAFYVYATTTPNFDLLGSASNSLESVSASNTLTDSFGGGRLMPSYVVVTFSQPIISNGSFNMAEMATLQDISTNIASRGGIQEVTGPTMPYGTPVDYNAVTNESDPSVYSGMLSAIGADNQSALITVKFSVDPYSTEAMNYAKDIRTELHQNYDDVVNVTGIYLGGTTGAILDTRMTFDNEFNSILPIVAVGVAIVLFIVLGSLILPVFAILSVLMSIVWTLAVTVLVFNAAFSYGLLFITPLILFVLLLGLGMDYNIFILTRIREEAAKGQHLNDAIVHAIQQTGGIITAAAIILAGSLGALMLSSNMMLREMGFAFAFSILIDALVVRTYLVPAVMSVFGKWNWYNPIKRLQRIKDLDTNKAQTTQTESNSKTE